MIRIALVFALLVASSMALAEDASSRIERLFKQAASGEIRFQKMVQPSKDSLAAMGDTAARILIPKLTSTDAREKLTLVDIYRGIGKVASPYLVAALNTKNKDQLKTTSRCLADIKDSTAIDALKRLTSHTDFTVRMEATTAISKSGRGEQTARILKPLLKDPVDIVRKCATYGLGASKHLSAVPLLLQSLSDDSYAVRLVAYDALVALDSLARKAIATALIGGDSGAAKVLLVRLCGQLSIDGSLGKIVELTEDLAPATRGWAIWSWSRLHDDLAPAKISALRAAETNPFVLSQIDVALEYLDSQKPHE